MNRRDFLQTTLGAATGTLFTGPFADAAAALRKKVKITDVKCMIVRGTWDWNLILGIASFVLEGKFVAVQRVVAAESGMLLAGSIEFVDGEARRQRIAEYATVREEPPVHFREAPHVVESEVKAVERCRLQ
jgi:hypothetical protein